ncbi:long-chain fatty acid--CoA ligase [Streptomyces sp. SAI-127]|uniref:long-chain-fatty-acid--CoA ligase n=1 Tax=Streptomyces sp. SAI-127 TaxID=2940543 RepID=UPI0024767E78|nr:long-chain fatty acid--CoA ligase [Streptomyces sp. SAI-127]MDH6493274.1 long-chain acyl-CoA synthetase [Streptomyces sp. SAI-127]
MTSSTRNVSGLLTRTASGYPARTAIVFGGDRISYAELDAASNRVANLLMERGIRPGEKVALSCTNIPQFTTIYFGILKAGAVVVPLNVLLKAREIAYHLNDSDATAYFAFEGGPELPIGREAWSAFQVADRAAHFFLIGDGTSVDGVTPDQICAAAVAGQPETFEMVERTDDDTAVILYTSGTTGQPKGAELRHRNVYDIARAGVQLFESDPAAPDVYLCVLPLFHAFGQMVIQNGAIGFGGTLVLQARFSARQALDLMLAHDVTFFGGVPTMYWGLIEALDDSVDVARLAANLRIAVSGGSALPAKIHQEFKKRFGVTILEGYGLSETVAIATFATYGDEPRVGSIGRPIAGVQMKLINDDWSDVADDPGAVGEIAIKGYNIMKGYYKRPEATSEAINQGWFRTGDLARKDADGFYFVVDRSKDMIIRGGFNVYPRELEEVLMEHPAVSLVAVIGVPHLSHGEEIKAVVVRKAGDTTTAAELTAWGKEQFAGYKYPRIVEFVDALPMTATGKILKRELS